jgi:hypothetical protein
MLGCITTCCHVQTYSVGHYDTEEEAAQAWDKVAFTYRGDKARAKLNFPHLVSELKRNRMASSWAFGEKAQSNYIVQLIALQLLPAMANLCPH